MALTNKLIAIADAIREKTGETGKYTLDEMPSAISGITTGGGAGGGYDIPDEAFVISGDCNYRFSFNGWNWFIEKFADKITTKNISSAKHMFNTCDVADIPFAFNFADGGADVSSMFYWASKIKSISSIDFKQTSTYKSCDAIFESCNEVIEIGTIKNLYPEKMSSMFKNCYKLRCLPEFENLNLNRIYTYQYAGINNMFSYCCSLRSIPEEFLNKLYTPVSTAYSNTIFSNGFQCCYTLDEVRGLNPQTGIITTNMFGYTFSDCNRVKNIIFATREDGAPYTVSWKSQTIDLQRCGHLGNSTTSYLDRIIGRNSGITIDKAVYNDETYQALKDDPDWFGFDPTGKDGTIPITYSRYNHDSAVNTINTLPDTSAYLAEKGGTNTIKFKGEAGSTTDGGAINTLTEEEIAVATAKGWTVTFV
jgi:hypothetical protein